MSLIMVIEMKKCDRRMRCCVLLLWYSEFLKFGTKKLGTDKFQKIKKKIGHHQKFTNFENQKKKNNKKKNKNNNNN